MGISRNHSDDCDDGGGGSDSEGDLDAADGNVIVVVDVADAADADGVDNAVVLMML